MRAALGLVLTFCGAMQGAANAASVSADRTATLVADNIYFSGDEGAFVAEGDVEVFWGEETLRAERLEYRDEVLQIEGPMSLTVGDRVVILAEAFELSSDLQSGILESVQVILAQDVQLAASRMERKDGTYFRLNYAVITTCRVCTPNEKPLWHYRARYVVHDTEARQLYLHDARLVIGDFALPAIPVLRIPDPTVGRQTGFLFPTLEFSREKGLQIEAPYFITLGDHADLTFSPLVSTKKRRALDFEYRRRFRTGFLTLEGSGVYNKQVAKRWQTRFGVAGAFPLGGDFKLAFDGENVSGKEYYDAAELTAPNRLESYVRLTRRKDRSFLDATVTYYKSMDSDAADTPSAGAEPNVSGMVSSRRRLSVPGLGGTTGLSVGVASFNRPKVPAGVVGREARDVTRGTVALDWTNTWPAGNGLLLTAAAVAAAHSYSIRNESVSDDSAEYRSRSLSTVTKTASLELRWPLSRTAGRHVEVLEPFAQVVWSPSNSDDAPNEDSRIVEFDQTNLRSLDRFGGMDRSEEGTRLNIGVQHTRVVPGTMEWELLLGRVFRNRDHGQFHPASGLAGKRSDYVGGLGLNFASGYAVSLSVLVDSKLDVSKNEVFVNRTHEDYNWSIGYSYFEDDTFFEADRETPASGTSREAWLGNSEFGLGRNWFTTTTVRYDRHKTERNADVGLVYRQQCTEFKVSMLHELATSKLPKKTTYSLSVSFNMIGRGAESKPVDQTCSG